MTIYAHDTDDLPWDALAACKGKPTAMFFEQANNRFRELRALCAGCPVAQECLDDALAFLPEDDWGWRAGMSKGERDAFRMQRERNTG